MNALTEQQKMRYDLLVANNYDVNNAMACYVFVQGDISLSPERQADSRTLSDGVYIMQRDAAPILFTGQHLEDEEKNRCYGVGVKLGGKSLVVSLADMTENEITLTSEKGGKRFINKYHEAVADWEGKANTEDIRNILNKEIELTDGEHIPSLGEWYFILLHIRDINRALKAVGGQQLAGWYWSSTQYSATYAWYLYLNYGYAGSYTKATTSGRVRAVSAFLPLNY